MFVILSLLDSCTPSVKPVADSDSQTIETYVGSSSCRSCHQKEYAEWKESDHHLAMHLATDSTVLGDFDSVLFEADGITTRFFRRDEKFFINTEGDDGKNHDFEVRYTFGYFPLQQYLIAFPGGRMQATRVSWDSRGKKWFMQYAGQEIQPTDWLHWTGNGQNWNTMCASCHSTHLQKNYDFSSDSYETTWNEMNVTCESCHGPGSTHINFINSTDYKSTKKILNYGLHYGKNPNPQTQLNTCASCHARKSDIGKEVVQSNEILDNMIPQIISDDLYFGDGQIKEEDYEYGSFTQSKMFHNNVRCSNCHNPHTGKLVATGNNLCMSCHEPKYATEEHHFHSVHSEGAQCITCHMPMKTYMGNDHRRDHSFRIPRPDQSAKFGTPNACTGCHSTQSNQWAANAIAKWYGPERRYHFSDDLLPGSQFTDKSEAHLLNLLKDTLQPEIARATAVFYLGAIHTQSAANALLHALNDKHALVRYHALRSLENFPYATWVSVAFPRLSDSVLAVRIAAADLYHLLPLGLIPLQAKNAYVKADEENKRYLFYQTDFALGNVMLADYELQQSDFANAIGYYLRGLEKDSLMNYARFNLAASYNALGKKQDALKILKEIIAIDSKNEQAYYNLGLLYFEMQDLVKASESFQEAVGLGSLNPSLYYNYGILLQQQDKPKEAEKILLNGFALNPQVENINYALTIFYINQQNITKAKTHALILQQINSDNPEYQSLFNRVGIE